MAGPPNALDARPWALHGEQQLSLTDLDHTRKRRLVEEPCNLLPRGRIEPPVASRQTVLDDEKASVEVCVAGQTLATDEPRAERTQFADVDLMHRPPVACTAATKANTQISLVYRRATDRATGPSRKLGATVTPKKISRRVICGARWDVNARSAMNPSIVAID